MISKENRKPQYLMYMKKVVVKGKSYRQAHLHNDYKDGYIFLVEAELFAEYETLNAWKRNGVMAKMSPDGREEALARLEAYVSKYSLDEVESADRIRFIDLQYKTAFTVPNFGYIVVNGERRQVYFIDEYHFGFAGGDVYHIRQWAELCEKNHISCTNGSIPNVLSLKQIKEYFSQRALYFERPDGSTSMVQDNGYSLEQCLKLYNMGFEFFVD